MGIRTTLYITDKKLILKLLFINSGTEVINVIKDILITFLYLK